MFDSKTLAIAVRAGTIAGEVVAFAREHEDAEHSGDVCVRNRVSIIAYLMQELGVNAGQILMFYAHPCPNCSHGKIEG